MTFNNPYKPPNIKIESRKRLIWLISFIGCGIYAIIVFVLLFLLPLPIWVKLIVIYSYMIIAPLTLYSLWMVFYSWKTRNWPQSEKLFGEKNHYTLLLLMIGICVVNWAAFWNSGINDIWLIYAYMIYELTGDILLASIIYTIGATAITPALGEEFLKSLPSIIAFFVVLQRDRNTERKRKGLLGNELGGFLFGLIIGITFEILELMYYLVMTILSGGGAFDIYLQVTVRNFAPIHILGGAAGGFAAGRAERLRYERGEENLPMKTQIMKFIKRFLPLWLIPVSIHFLWNSSSVWIFLIVIAINGDMLLYLILEIIVIVTLSALCFLLLVLLLRRANRVADKSYRCSETGIIVGKEGVICSSFNDKYSNSEKFDTDQQGADIACPNCNTLNISSTNYCVQCGFFIKQLKTTQFYTRLYNRPSKNLLIVSLIGTILFLIYVLIFAVLALLVYGIFGLLYIAIQSSIELVAVGLMLYSIITLFKLRDNYNGRKSIWAWHMLIFNLIGFLGLLLIYGISGVIYGAVALSLGYYSVYFIQMLFGILFLIGATVIFIFLLKAMLKSKQMLHYQRNY